MSFAVKIAIVNGSFNNIKPISAGILQGFILGPLIFVLFTNDVYTLCKKNIEIYLYADDTVIIFHTNNVKELQTIINNFFLNYSTWCEANCIVINLNESYFLISHVKNITKI